jgi:hypothetical protein
MSSVELLNAVSTQFSIYFGIVILVTGVVGNIFNILVFLSLRIFRENSCAFYLTAMSFLNIGQLISSLFPRIMNLWFAIDWTVASLAYCKLRAYFFQLCSLTSFTCMCLATIDQFLATSSRPHWQRFSNIKFAYRCFIIAVLIWILHGIPTLIYQNHIVTAATGDYTCAISNRIFQYYYTYGFILILVSCLPVLITAVFGSLAYCNVTNLAYRAVPLVRRELDKQLTVMVLVQVLFNFCLLMPYIIVNVTNLGVSINKYSYSYAQLQLARNITIALYYIYYAVSVDNHVNYKYQCIDVFFLI